MLEINYIETVTSRCTTYDLIVTGEDELKDEVIRFLNSNAMTGVNGFNEHYLSEYNFDSDGHHRWDFVYKDMESKKDLSSLVSLNLAWDCWYECTR